MKELKKLTPFKYFALTNFPYIEADFDALTNYELYSKICEYINNIASSQNDVIDDFNELYDTWLETKEYIDNYFENLNVQEEINNKLDEMASNGTLTTLIKPFFDEAINSIPSLVTTWLNTNITEPEGVVIDKSLSITNACADAKATGDKIREIESELIVSYDLKNEYVITDIIDGERYVSTGIQTNADYKRAKYLYPIEPFKLIQCADITSGDEMSVCFYDKDFTFIERRYIYTPEQLYASCYASKNARYFGFSLKNLNTNTSYTLHIIGDGKCENIDRNFSDNLKSYLLEPNRVITQQGNKNNSENYDLLVIPNPNADTIYCSFNVASNGMMINDNGESSFITPSIVSGEDYARRFTIPTNCKIFFMCFPKALQTSEDNLNMSYANLIRTAENPLNKKRIMCIGASATRIDQHSTPASGSTGGFVGWQKWLKWNGGFCTNKGKSGYCYSTGYGSGSLYTEVVTNQMDISNEDIIVLFGGQNDAQYNAPIGTPPTDYETISTDASNMCGAINGIMNYIRTNKPTAKVFIITPYKSSLSNLSFAHVKPYIEAIKACGEFWSAKVIDLFSNCGISPAINSETFLYDGIHPNTKGAELIGKLITSDILKELTFHER